MLISGISRIFLAAQSPFPKPGISQRLFTSIIIWQRHALHLDWTGICQPETKLRNLPGIFLNLQEMSWYLNFDWGYLKWNTTLKPAPSYPVEKILFCCPHLKTGPPRKNLSCFIYLRLAGNKDSSGYGFVGRTGWDHKAIIKGNRYTLFSLFLSFMSLLLCCWCYAPFSLFCWWSFPNLS